MQTQNPRNTRLNPRVVRMLYLLGCLKVLFDQVLHPQPLHRSDAFHHSAVIHVYLVWKRETRLSHRCFDIHLSSTAAPLIFKPDLWCLPSSPSAWGSEWCLWGWPHGPRISGWSEKCWTCRSRRCSPPADKRKVVFFFILACDLTLFLQTQPSHPQADERLLRGERAADSFSLSLF